MPHKPKKIRIYLFSILLYLFPVFITAAHLVKQTEFFRGNWIFYVIGFGLLVYTHISYCGNKNRKTENFVRKIYFLYTYFFILYVFPEINRKYAVWVGDGGISGLSAAVSTCIVIIIISFIVYITVISDFHISEISFGNTKISMLKEKYGEEISSHFKNTNQLLEKISAEGQIIYDMKEYCLKVKERIDGGGIYVTKEYQILLTEYFNRQKDKVKVSVLQELNKNELKNDFNFKSGEINILKYKLEHRELYSTEVDSVYYLFIPFCYVFEELLGDEEKPVYVVLESQTPISVEAESTIIRNILIKFADDLLQIL